MARCIPTAVRAEAEASKRGGRIFSANWTSKELSLGREDEQDEGEAPHPPGSAEWRCSAPFLESEGKKPSGFLIGGGWETLRVPSSSLE
jgi:hypothetical protein